MKRFKLVMFSLLAASAALALESCTPEDANSPTAAGACLAMFGQGIPRAAAERAERYLAKVPEAAALCRGGPQAVKGMNVPWLDWANYFGASDASRGVAVDAPKFSPPSQGVQGALLDLELERVDLVKFNLFDNNGTYRNYILGRNGVAGPALKSWDSLRLPKEHPNYKDVGGDATQQVCTGELLRKRTVTGICNDQLNPLMGSSGQLFARNVEFETTFPDEGLQPLTANRHGGRLSLLQPDPQVISRRLFTRNQAHPETCREGYGAADPAQSNCDYQKAPFMNVLGAFWIQFMTHDWFSHLEEGHNDTGFMKVGCESQRVNNVEKPLSPEEIQRLGCRPGDRIDRGYIAGRTAPNTFSSAGKQYMERSPKTSRNTNTAWWDASQIYGFDDVSVKRVKRDPKDRAKLLMSTLPGAAELGTYLPLLESGDPMNPEWAGQEATAFADNWTVGMSFLTNVFAREHNAFVEAFRKQTAATPNADCGLRSPALPGKKILYKEVTDEELYDAARLVVAAEIAKIHSIEWTPQLLYNEPLYAAMNGNWSGLLGAKSPVLKQILGDIVKNRFGQSTDPRDATQWYSVFASFGPGIVGLGSRDKNWDITKPESVNGGVNHFGSPFNFPEEFVAVYRLHPLIPDLIEYRDLKADPNKIAARLPVIDTFRGKATEAMHSRGLANWALSFGRQRLGLLTLRNYPMFLQSLKMDRLDSATKQIDIAALDLIRDREHGVPRFNEFRRQYGLRQLTGFDDFIDSNLPAAAPDRVEQEDRVKTLREIYGQHVCDNSKQITDAQHNPDVDKSPITDCLGKPNGTLIDNIEDVDLVVGILAEPVRPHGFAISETQFVVFLLNASRRLFSDRFLTSSYRPEFYTTMGLDWVNNNGPGKPGAESVKSNGHEQVVSPMKRVLLRAMPELGKELDPVVNAFDPWARSRGEYYTLEWKPRPGAETDDAFRK